MSVALLDNTPWWLPGVSIAGARGLLVQRCDPFGESGLRGLEGGFYGPEHLGQYMWHCTARADGRYRTRCRCGHTGHPRYLCTGHVQQFIHRMSGVCPPCVHPPREIELQAMMQATRERASEVPTLARLHAAEDRLWDLQDQLNELVERGIVHRCRLRIEEVA